MRKTWAWVGVSVGIAFAAMASPADASHASGDYHWARQANPFTLKLGDNVGPAWDGYLRTASGQWSKSGVLNTTVAAGTTTPKECRASLGRVEVCSAFYGRNGWLGVASISLSGSHITKATVKVNNTYYSLARYNTPESRAHTMCQEIGHTFGLGHTSENGSSQQTCMDYSDDPDSIAPNAHDYGQLATIYAHLDKTTTVGTTSATSARSVRNDRSSWGREVERSANGSHSTFVRDLGHGNRVITEVTWAQ